MLGFYTDALKGNFPLLSGIGSFLLMIVLGLAVPYQAHAQLISHRAFYKIELASAKAGAQIVDIKGNLAYQWKETCDAWITDHKFNLRYDYSDNQPMRIESDFSTFETIDGKSLDFTSRRTKDGSSIEELRGRAEHSKTGEGEAVFTLPENLKHTLPKGTVFPTEHTKMLLEKAEKGEKFYSVAVFDGSDEEGPVEVNTFIGKKIMPDKNEKDKMLSVPAWKVRMAFFPLHNDNDVADYELSMTIYNNGLIRDMVIDYDDFSVRQSLLKTEIIKAEECKP